MHHGYLGTLVPNNPQVNPLKTVSRRTFEDNLNKHAPQALAKHLPIKVTSPDGNDFVVVSAAEWSTPRDVPCAAKHGPDATDRDVA